MRYTVRKISATEKWVRLVLVAPHVPSVLPSPGSEVAVLEQGPVLETALQSIEQIDDVDDLFELARAVNARLDEVCVQRKTEAAQSAEMPTPGPVPITGETEVPGDFGASVVDPERDR